MRVRPRPAIGVGVFVGYLVLLSILLVTSGVDYDEVADSTENVVRFIVIPVGVGVAVLAVVTSLLGWWRPAFTERRAGPTWMLAIPALVLVAGIVGVATSDIGDFGGNFVLWLAVGTLFVGFTEELLTRGLLLTSLRGAMGEVGVWFFTSLAFGLMHGLNLLFGQGVGSTLQQIVFAFLFGSVMYASRRTTGLLVVPMALHALWDFAMFLHEGAADATTTTTATNAGPASTTLIGMLAIVLFVAGMRMLLRQSPDPAADEPQPAASSAPSARP